MIAIMLAFAVSLVGLIVFRLLAPRWGLMDSPVARSQHKEPVLVGAGVAIAVGTIAGFSVLEASGVQLLAWPKSFAMISVSLALVGLFDDRFTLSSGLRLVVYFLACGLLFFLEGPGPWPWLVPLLIVAHVWMINLFNFMDGLDGFAATQALCVTLGIGLLASMSPDPAPAVALLSATLFAAILPFLWFNWPPAQCFMGDAGAVFIGFILGAIGLFAAWHSLLLGVAWLILMMPFIVDATGTLVLRLVQGHAPHHAHSDHCFQRFARLTGSALAIDLGLLLLQLIWQFPLAVWVVNGAGPPIPVLALSFIPAIILMAYSRFSE